jgi:hypothetical protein
LDGRWSDAEDLQIVSQQLQTLPDRCGDWVLKEQQELDEGAAQMLRCYGSCVRLYHNEVLNADVNVAVLFGPRGSIAVHTPEVCYSSIGTKQVGETVTRTISTKTTKHNLWSARFSKDPDPNPVLNVWYAWSDGGNWHASKHPRFWMTDNLYKIQVAGPVGEASQQPCADFLKAFLPYLEKVVL